jgi:hypothetical protein
MDEQKKNIWGIYRQENKKFWEELIAYFTWYDKAYIETDASKNKSIVACVFLAGVMF